MNKIILLGRLTKDPEIRYTQATEPMCVAKYTIAVNRRFKKEGKQDVDFINCVSFAKAGEFVERFLKKGMAICLSGSLQIEEYTDKNGQRQWFTQVVTEEIDFTESREAYEARMSRNSNNNNTSPQKNYEPDNFSAIAKSIDDDDDLPF